MFTLGLTTDNIQGTECNVVEAVEGSFACLFVKFLYQNLRLFIHHLQELVEDGEVEGGGQHLSSPAPFVPCAEQ